MTMQVGSNHGERARWRREFVESVVRSGDVIKVLALNAWHDLEQRDRRNRAVAAMINETDADIVCIQEVPVDGAQACLDALCHGTGVGVVAVGEGSLSYTAILSRWPAKGETAVVYSDGERRWEHATAVIESSGATIRCTSVHQPWGGLNEQLRVGSAQMIDREHRTRPEVDAAICAGDFNAVGDAASIRYLTGVLPIEGECAQWTDVWAVAGDGDGTTSSGSNPWAVRVAQAHQFDIPELIPDRRIDYVFVRGYAHGRLLAPLRCRVMRDWTHDRCHPSDHWGVLAELYLPNAGGAERTQRVGPGGG